MGRSRDRVRLCLRFTALMIDIRFSNHLTSLVDERTQLPLKRHIFSQDVAVQTDSVIVSTSPPPEEDIYPRSKESPTDDDVISKLTAADLASILKWSKEISRDINLSLALQRLTEIATGE